MAAAPAPRLANATATTPAAPGSGSVGGRASERHDRAHGWLDAVSGVVAGGVTRTVVAPLDVVKIRFQLQHLLYPRSTHNGPAHRPHYTGMWQAFRSVYAEEGAISLWRGNYAGTLLWMGYGGVQFLVYGELLQYMQGVPSSAQGMVAGCCAGGVATASMYPLDLLRTRIAGQGVPKAFPSTHGMARHIVATEGLPGLYRGMVPALAQNLPLVSIQFACYKSATDWLLNSDLPWSKSSGVMASVGVLSGVVAKSAVYPLETVKRRLQGATLPRHERYGPRVAYSGVLQCFSSILRREGAVALYQGMWPSIIKAGVSAGLSFGVYEFAQARLQPWATKD